MSKIALFPKQIEFYNLKDNEALLEGGIAYGKSRVASIWLAEQCQLYSRSKWFMVARDYKQLKTAVDEEFEMYLHDVLHLRRGVHYQKTSGSPIIYEWRNGTKIFGVGAHNYDTVFRAGNYNGAWGDELDYWKPAALKALRGRIRIYPELKRFTSSPDGYNHVYEDFHVNKVGPVITATSYENPTLSDTYLNSLKKTYSAKLFQQEVMAQRLNLTVGQVYSEFSREKHVKECHHKLEKDDTIYFFTDYNIANYCGVYLLFKRGKVYCIGEEHLQYKQSKDMAERIKAKYPKHVVFVAGDSTGNNKRDVAVERTNYAQFQDAGLKTINFKNPFVKSRIISANSNFYHKKCVIDPSCKTLIKDLELVSWKEDGSDIDKSNIDLSHASDAFTYGLYHFLAVTIQRKSRTIQL